METTTPVRGGTSGDPPAPGRTRRNRGSEIIRNALIDAGIDEFAANGFEGASTRSIAEAASAHQSQIKYHFDSKDELWRRCVARLLDELDQAIATYVDPDRTDPTAAFEALIRGLVQFMARRPQLNRIMAHEATRSTDRLRWLVDHHLRARHRALTSGWRELAEQGVVAAIDPDLVYHTVIGASALLYSHGPEAELLGTSPDDPDLIERHADTLVALFLRPSVPPAAPTARPDLAPDNAPDTDAQRDHQQRTNR